MCNFQITQTTTRIRDMAREDLDRVGQVLFDAFNSGASKHGYAPRMQSAQEGVAWAGAMLRHGPHEILVAEQDDRVAGVCCLSPRGAHGGVGPVAVDPLFQGLGIGRQLMNALLARRTDLQSVRLFQEAFNPASFSLYYSLDFSPVAELLDLFRGADAGRDAGPDSHVSVVTTRELDEVHAYDLARSSMDRLNDLAYYARWGKLLVFRSLSRVRGFLACLPGPQSVQLGPLVADGEEEAGRLFEHAASVFNGRPCQTRVMAKDHLLVRTLEQLGWKLYCLNILMVRGAWQPGRHVEAFGRFPEGV